MRSSIILLAVSATPIGLAQQQPHQNAVIDLWAQGKPARVDRERRAAAEAGTPKVLAQAKRAKLADMLTANPQDVAQRVRGGFLALLMQGASADEAITLGRAAAGR